MQAEGTKGAKLMFGGFLHYSIDFGVWASASDCDEPTISA
jgi:hypothetical protein